MSQTARDYFNEEFRKRLETENDTDSEKTNEDGSVKPKTVSYLRNKKGNPRFRGFLRDFQYAFVRNNLSYYVMQYEVTDFNDGLGAASGSACVGYTPAKLLDLTTQFNEAQPENQLESALTEGITPTEKDNIISNLSNTDSATLEKFLSEYNKDTWNFVETEKGYNLIYSVDVGDVIYNVTQVAPTRFSKTKATQAGTVTLTFNKQNYLFE